MSTKTSVFFPVLDDREENKEFRKHAIGLATAMCQAVADYMDEQDDDNTVSAMSIGAACFVAAHLISLNFEDERKDQVTRGLVATLALNAPGNTLDLAKIPPTKDLN